MAQLSLSLLGPLQVTLVGQPVAGFESDKVRALLAYLAVESDRPQRRDMLVGLLWPDRPERKARQNLSQALANLRRAIGDRQAAPSFLITTHQTVQFNSDSDCWLDVRVFTDMLATCKRCQHTRLASCDACLARLKQAVGLYQGSFLEGFSLPDSPPFEEWALLEREQLHRLAVDAFQDLVSGLEARGEYEAAHQYAWREVELDPWREEAHQQLMRLLALDGQRSEALAQYETCRRLLAEELGVEPGAETRQLYEQIRDGKLSRGAGERGSRGEISFVPRHNLPVQTTPFVGREKELAKLARLLAEPELRLLTILGPGGMGKTRLALEVAQTQLERFAHGVHFVPLVPLSAPALIVPAIAEAVDFPFQSDQRPLQQQLLNYFHQKEILLILDNFEHLLAGADLVSEILAAAPGLRLLVTSRERLKLSGEVVFALEGLDVPAEDGMVQGHSAVELFLQRVRRLQPGFAAGEDDLRAIARICRLVGGMPLGIILAASWIEVLTPPEIAAEIGKSLDFLETDLRDIPDRQHSIRVVCDQSWRMLGDEERSAFGQLSVFRGGLTREAAQAVADASLRTLMGLVNKSFLGRTPAGRFEVHELLRQYGAERLAQAADAAAATRDRHSAYYADFLQQREADWKGAGQQTTLAEIALDIDNVLLAWSWATERRNSRLLARMLDCLGEYCSRSGLYQIAADIFGEIGAWLGNRSTKAEVQLWARLLIWQGIFVSGLGRTEQAIQLYEQVLALLDEPNLAGADTLRAKAKALREIGFLLREFDLPRARQLCEQSVQLYQALGNQWRLAWATTTLAEISWRLGQIEQADRYAQKSLQITRRLDDKRGIIYALETLNKCAKMQWRLADAERNLKEMSDLKKGIGYEGETLVSEHHLLALQGRYERAYSLAMKQLEIYREAGARQDQATMGVWAAYIEIHLGLYAEAASRLQECHQLAEDVKNRLAAADAAIMLGQIAMATDDLRQAQIWLQEGISGHRKTGWSHLSVALTCRGYLHIRRRQYQPAIADIREATQFALDRPFYEGLFYAIPVYATLLLEQGEIERAIEIYSLAAREPFVANSRWFEDVAGRHIVAAAETLPPAVIEAAKARGRARDLWQTAEELLAELEA